jgi:hypothetical protein
LFVENNYETLSIPEKKNKMKNLTCKFLTLSIREIAQKIRGDLILKTENFTLKFKKSPIKCVCTEEGFCQNFLDMDFDTFSYLIHLIKKVNNPEDKTAISWFFALFYKFLKEILYDEYPEWLSEFINRADCKIFNILTKKIEKSNNIQFYITNSENNPSTKLTLAILVKSFKNSDKKYKIINNYNFTLNMIIKKEGILIEPYCSCIGNCRSIINSEKINDFFGNVKGLLFEPGCVLSGFCSYVYDNLHYLSSSEVAKNFVQAIPSITDNWSIYRYSRIIFRNEFFRYYLDMKDLNLYIKMTEFFNLKQKKVNISIKHKIEKIDKDYIENYQYFARQHRAGKFRLHPENIGNLGSFLSRDTELLSFLYGPFCGLKEMFYKFMPEKLSIYLKVSGIKEYIKGDEVDPDLKICYL